MKTPLNLKIRGLCQFIVQIITVAIDKVIFLPITKRDLGDIASGLESKSYIVVSNHKGFLDPLIMTGCLPFKHAAVLAPAALMTTNLFYDSIVRPICWMIGCYPAHNPTGKHKIYGVEGSNILLKNGFSVFIFPEGKRVVNMERGPAHSGVIRIHQANPDTPILLCHIIYHKSLRNLLAGKFYEVRYRLARQPSYSDAEAMMDELFAL